MPKNGANRKPGGRKPRIQRDVSTDAVKNLMREYLGGCASREGLTTMLIRFYPGIEKSPGTIRKLIDGLAASDDVELGGDGFFRFTDTAAVTEASSLTKGAPSPAAATSSAAAPAAGAATSVSASALVARKERIAAAKERAEAMAARREKVAAAQEEHRVKGGISAASWR